MTAPFAPLVPVIGAPLLVGVAGALLGGSVVAGRRIARLAAISAGLGLYLYLYGTIAVAVIGVGGPPEDTGWTVGSIISDRLGNNVIKMLVFLPLVTATIRWAARVRGLMGRGTITSQARLLQRMPSARRPGLIIS